MSIGIGADGESDETHWSDRVANADPAAGFYPVTMVRG